MKPFELHDQRHLEAAQGWFELGNCIEATKELEQITPQIFALFLDNRHPSQLPWPLISLLETASTQSAEPTRPALQKWRLQPTDSKSTQARVPELGRW
jgi:hypothetical protein